MYKIVLNASTVLLALALVASQSAMAGELPKLTAMLSAPNQNGTHPDFVTDDFGTVPSTATGEFSAELDLSSNQLLNITLNVVGMSKSDLKNFGPNMTPFHLHLPNSGKQGDFGFNVIDLLYGADDSQLVDTENGFSFYRESMSILAADQGKYQAAGVHPGDEKIGELLVKGFPFILVHSSKDIFTNTKGKFPNGKPVPVGFPFGELRGEVTMTR